MQENPYETPGCVAEYLLAHYGPVRELCAFGVLPRKAVRFHHQILKECVLPLPFEGPTRGLDIGCGVGRFTFELSHAADSVLGIDSSKAFIEAAQQMARSGSTTISMKESGAEFRSIDLTLPVELRQSKVEFQVGDAMDLSALPEHSFHIVAAINLICRLSKPREFLAQLHRLVAPAGQLIIASPFSWLEEFTPRDQWLNSQQLKEVLRPHFRRVSRHNLPFVIREHRRKFQLIVSDVALFIRRE